MAVIDAVFLGIVVVSLCLGAWRGLMFELFSLAGWVAGFFVARLFAEDVAHWLPFESWDATVRYGIGFVLTFVLAVFAWGLVSALVKKLVDAVGLRPVDRTFGAIFGLLRAMVLILVLTVIVVSTTLHEQYWWAQSVAAPWAASAVERILPALTVDWDRLMPAAPM